MKELKDLTFADDFMFTHILTTRKDICKKLLELLLHIEIVDIEYPEREKSFKTGYDSHGIRVDVFVKGSDRIFDIELQTSMFENLPMRARYYQSIIDEGALNKGANYIELKESYIIFICTQDPFGDKKPVYTVEQRFKESGKIYNDKSHKIFYNVIAFSDVADDETKGFLQFVKTGEAETSFAREIMEAVDYAKMADPDFYHHYMMVRLHEFDLRYEGRKEGIAIGEERGIAQGAHKKAVETARTAILMGMTQDVVAKLSGLPVAEIEQLQNTLKEQLIVDNN